MDANQVVTPVDVVYPSADVVTSLTPAQVRKSVTLTAEDLAHLTKIRTSPDALRAVGAQPGMSEAALLHALVEAGIRVGLAAAGESGYAALARSYADDPDERAIRTALRNRRRSTESPAR